MGGGQSTKRKGDDDHSDEPENKRKKGQNEVDDDHSEDSEEPVNSQQKPSDELISNHSPQEQNATCLPENGNLPAASVIRSRTSIDKGESLQIIQLVSKKVNGNEVYSLELNEENLAKVMLHPEVKDKPIVIVSVAGGFRNGKSFLLGFFFKYLETEEEAWLTADDVIEGFKWRGGCKRITSGIHIWSKPFIRVNECGQEVAVLLMDTQGLLDSECTLKDSARIFALSSLLSSVQIYNIMPQLQEDDLQHLEFFTEYGRMVSAMSEHSNVNKARLVFLVRDWQHTCDYPYGLEGGNAYVKTKLQVKPNQPQELQRLRRNIHSAFQSIVGFLLPRPSEAVATQPTFSGRVKDFD